MIAEKKHISIDTVKLRQNFPILSRQVNGKPLIYLDNAATTQKPKAVIDSITNYYTNQNANIHRGVHKLSQDITTAYENARITIQKHLNAKNASEIIFTKGTTEGINLVASALAKLPSPTGEGLGVRRGDEILVSEMEHHSNILPWQTLCEDTLTSLGVTLKVIPVNDKGELNLEEFKKLLSPKTKVVAITHVSNTLGTINPVKEIIHITRQLTSPFGGEDERGTAVLIDGAQAVPHMKVDVQDLDADFYTFSGHKVYGPTGVGILYMKEKWMKQLPNYQVGGGTIKTVSFKKTEYMEGPLRFEAGTPHIEGGIGLAAALDYINKIGLDNIQAYEHELLEYATEKLNKIAGLRIIGTAKDKASVISFVIEGLHPLDIGTILDKLGIAVRTGHHCTQPLMEHFGIQGTVRASFAFYNTKEEVDELAKGIEKAVKMLK